MFKPVTIDNVDVWRSDFFAQLDGYSAFEQLFDRAPDMVFSIKDRGGRYVIISETCVERCGLSSKREALGKTAMDLFPPHMAERYVEQDEQLFRTGEAVLDNLDLTLFNDRQPGWCLTNKFPLRNKSGAIVGLICLSKDLHEPSRSGLIDARFVQTIDYLLAHFNDALRVTELAERAGLTEAQFERRMKKVFGLSAGQYLMKTRIDAASVQLMTTDDAIADIALHCGFCDQSALSRQFKQLTGLTPNQYRKWMQK